MPTYDYHCSKCKGTFELFQSMKDEPITVCPKELCQRKTWGKGEVKRQLGTGAGLIFKGTGFYQTDYRSAGYKEAAKKDVAPSGDSKSTSETKSTESKSTTPAEKPKATPKKD